MGGDVNRSKLCPNCVKYVDDQDATCRHCGYRFDTGDIPATAAWSTETGSGAAAVSSGEQGAPVIRVQNPDSSAVHTIDLSQQMRTAQKAGKWIGLIVLLIVVAGIAIPIFMVARGADSAVDGFTDFEVPGVSIPSIEFTPPSLGTEGTGSFAACRDASMRWMKEMLANDGTGSRPLDELFIAASEDVGALSDDYTVIITAFSGAQGTALSKGTRAGLREARALVTEGCREAYP